MGVAFWYDPLLHDFGSAWIRKCTAKYKEIEIELNWFGFYGQKMGLETLTLWFKPDLQIWATCRAYYRTIS